MIICLSRLNGYGKMLVIIMDAGAYGLSVFDNTYEIHFKTLADSTIPVEIGNGTGRVQDRIVKFSHRFRYGLMKVMFLQLLIVQMDGSAGTIPVNQEDFVLKASITDPPLLLAKIVNERLKAERIKISGKPTTIRLEQKPGVKKTVQITETISPPLAEIIAVLNHESVNLFAEHLIKELGKKFKNNGQLLPGLK